MAGSPLGGARRILVYGVTGSGKTVLAERISRRISAICEQPEWILDSAYGQWVDEPAGPQVSRLTSPRLTRAWLATLGTRR